MERQRTIKKQASLKGIGIHTGAKVDVTFKPALPDSGINFVRADLPGKPAIPADISYLLNMPTGTRRTSIGKDGIFVYTIEHYMASFFGLGIDNICIEINSTEPPGLDGSAKEIVNTLKAAGICEQDAERKTLSIKEPLWIEERDSAIIVLPSENLSISYVLDYGQAALESQYNHIRLDPAVFETEIAPSRTFCLKEEVNELLNKGIGKGASLSNTIVIDNKGAPSAPLRFKDEFLRHKILDLIGDIFLIGYFLKAHIIGIKSGHSLNLRMTQEIRKKYPPEQKPEVRGQKSENKPIMDREQIKTILPHREPFLLVDEIIEIKELSAVGVKHVNESEYYFKGHFPGRPIMPGVLIIEALAQVGGVLLLNKPENQGRLAYFMSINNAKFRKTVVPGDKLRLEVEVVKLRTKTGLLRGRAFVAEALVAEADLMCSIVD